MSSPFTIVFDAYFLYHLAQFDPLIDILEEDERFRIVLTTCAENEPEEIALTKQILSQRNCDTLFADSETERADRINRLAPHVFICGTTRYDLPRFVPDSTLVGMIYHGIGVKPSYWRDNHPRLDVRFVEGPFRERQLREKGVKTATEMTGFAKLDPLFNDRIPDQQTLLLSMGLDPGKKTVLYAPTFYPSSFESFGTSLCKYTEAYNLIIKPHMWVYLLKKLGINFSSQRRLLDKIRSGRFDHVLVLDRDDYNIVRYYRAADVLITEASSTIYEMMALDKPVVVSRFFKLRWSHRLLRRRLYKRRLDQEMSDQMTQFCVDLQRAKDLPHILERVFDGYDPRPEVRKHYKKDMLFKLDGKASERIRDAILRRLCQR